MLWGRFVPGAVVSFNQSHAAQAHVAHTSATCTLPCALLLHRWPASGSCCQAQL